MNEFHGLIFQSKAWIYLTCGQVWSTNLPQIFMSQISPENIDKAINQIEDKGGTIISIIDYAMEMKLVEREETTFELKNLRPR